MKLFKKSLWILLSVFFAIGFAVSAVGTEIAKSYSAHINDIFGINIYEIVDDENSDADTEYYKSDYYNADGSYDDEKMRANSISIAKQVGVEGATLLWNNDQALPLSEGNKISLFGLTSVDYLFGGGGSGHINVTTTDTLKSAIEDKGLSVNTQLWNAYRLCRTSYGRATVSGFADPNYYEFTIGEPGWDAVNSTTMGNVTNSIAQYGDAAVMLISRNGSEAGDVAFYTDECLDNCFLDLSYEEEEVLTKLDELKKNGSIKKIVLLINTANAMQFKNIVKHDIDACMWVGMDGNASYYQIADLLSGVATPSGHLVDEYVYDNDSAPANENFGDYTFTESAGVPAMTTYTNNDKYVVYQEGIYVGYRYYETRYEDSVLGNGNANSSSGVFASTQNWNYADEVIYSFGYGQSYTEFEYSNYSVKKSGENYEVSLTIKNIGSKYSGKEVMQVYLQKPYTEYDKSNGIEKASVELVGFAKTKTLSPGESQTLTVTVKAEEFKTYDAYKEGTYILEKGDYYLAIGQSAHDALNNILAEKGKTISDGMDYDGNKDFAKKITVDKNDFEKYSVSSYTGNTVTNQFNDSDVNLYEGTKGQEIVYLSRSNWESTYPSAVKLTCISAKMIEDMQYGFDPIVEDAAEMPVYDTVGEYGQLTLIMLKDLDYDDPMWDELLNQLTWEETNILCTYGANAIAGATSVAAPGCKAKDGPCGIGITNENLSSLMAIPSNTLICGTWNEELSEKMGNAFGMEILHVGYTGIYGLGADLHRSAYGGRSWEYYSEDGFLTGKMCAAESRGLVNRGVILFTKHFALNDQEHNRYGGTVWANEQAIREIYLKCFEISIVEGETNGLMSSFNRIGCTWAGSHKGLLTEVLRNEWGFIGIVETDAGVGTHMLTKEAMAEGIVAGNDLWMTGGSASAWDYYKDNATVCQALRESAHRILYTQLHSAAMNGLSASSKIVLNTPWWESALNTVVICFGVLTAICLAFTAVSVVISINNKKKNIKNEEN